MSTPPIEQPKLSELEKAELKISLMRLELQQYMKDLHMWTTAHGSEYPLRRMEELRLKIDQIEKI